MPATLSVAPELALMLDDIGREPAERTRMLVAADFADERAGLPSLAVALRELAAPGYRDILATGSRVYGKPRPDSDWDWVILFGRVPVPLWSAADTRTESDDEYRGARGIDFALRFGPLNLLVCTERDQLTAWEKGTALLVAERDMRGPRTRERAVEVFQAQFRAAGLAGVEPL